MPITALAVGTPFLTNRQHTCAAVSGSHAVKATHCSSEHARRAQCRVAGSPIVGESAPTIDCIWTLIADVSSWPNPVQHRTG